METEVRTCVPSPVWDQVRVCPVDSDNCVKPPLKKGAETPNAPTPPQQLLRPKSGEMNQQQASFLNPGGMAPPLPVGPLLTSASLQIPARKGGGASREGAQLAFRTPVLAEAPTSLSTISTPSCPGARAWAAR